MISAAVTVVTAALVLGWLVIPDDVFGWGSIPMFVALGVGLVLPPAVALAAFDGGQRMGVVVAIWIGWACGIALSVVAVSALFSAWSGMS